MKRKLILLNGFAGVGKSTLAHKYISENPLTLCLEGDVVMGMIGEWRKNETHARDLKLSLILAMLETHLKNGQSVILPYLVTNAEHVKLFEDIARKYDAEFKETYLFAERQDATKYLLERGRWGEEGSKLLTEEDVPHIQNLYDLMATKSAKRSNMKKVEVVRGDIERTYQNFLTSIE